MAQKVAAPLLPAPEIVMNATPQNFRNPGPKKVKKTTFKKEKKPKEYPLKKAAKKAPPPYKFINCQINTEKADEEDFSAN